MQHPHRTVEREIALVANTQHGLVRRQQLLGRHITPEQIRRRLATGALLIEYPGVYRVGHRAPSIEATYLAAVFACGNGALLAGAAAAHLYEIVRGAAPPPEVITRTERHIDGIVTHRARRGDARDAARWRGVPITTVARTLVDLAAVLAEEHLARAVHEAEVRFRTRPHDVELVLRRRPGSPGAKTLRRVLNGEVPVTLSRLESTFLSLLKGADLALPQTNRFADAHRVDCRWPAHRVTVELDSYRYHATRYAWEQDRLREREARARGDEIRRYTWDDVTQRPGVVLGELRVLLAQRCPA